MAFPTGSTAKKVTIDNTKVSGSSNLTDFPVLIKDGNIPSEVYAGMQDGEINNSWLLADANLEAYYRFESGALTTDSSGNSQTLTNNNTVGETTGVYGGASDLGASNSNKSFSRASGMGTSLISNYSVIMRIKLKTEIGSGVYELLDLNENTGKAKLYIQYEYNSGTRRIKVQQDRWVIEGYSATINKTLGTTDFYTLVVSKSSTTITVYLISADGTIDTATVTNNAFTTIGDTNPGDLFYIGYNGSTNYSSIIYDDLAVLSRAVTRAEVLALYYGGADLRFTSDSAGTTELPFEIVSLDTVAETSEIWVKVPTVDYNDDTEFYLWYGDATLTPYAVTDTYGRNNVWTGSLARYHLQASSIDSSGNESTGTDTSMTWSSGKIGSGAVFNGTTGNINLGSNIFSNANVVDGTISMWVKINGAPAANDKIFSMEGYLDIEVTTSGFIRAMSDGTPTWATGNDSVVDDVWHKVVVTWDVDDTDVYVDDIFDANATATASPTPDSTSRAVRLGSDHSGTANIYTGSLDDVDFVASILTADWISTEYANQNSPSTFLTITDVVITIDLTETITIVDSVSKGPHRSLAESITLTDAIATAKVQTRIFLESISITDSFSRVGTFIRTLTETITISDTLTKVYTAVKSLSETISITDTFTRTYTAIVNLTESITITDTIKRFVNTYLFSIWSKIGKTSTSYTKSSKPSSDIWTKESKPEA